MKSKLMFTALLGIVISMVMTFLYFKSQLPESARHNLILEQITLVKHANFNLNESLFDTVSRKTMHYDTLVKRQRELSHKADTLVGDKYGLGQLHDPDINKLSAELTLTIKQKNTLIETIKSGNAMLFNSLNHYSSLVREIDELSHANKLYLRFHKLAQTVISFVIRHDSNEYLSAKNQLQDLKKDLNNGLIKEAARRPQLTNFLAHSEVILNAVKKQSDIPSISQTIPIASILGKLHNYYIDYYNTKTRSAELYGRILFISSLLLIALIAYILVLLAKGNIALARQTEMAHASNQTKSSFLANMSHEIRTPLTVIIGFAESSLDSKQTLEGRLSAIRSIARNGKHLLQLINEILDISKIESGKLKIEKLPTNIFEILNEIMSVMRPQAEDKGLSLEIDCQFPVPKIIITDPIRFRQILFNLLSNAIKFTDKGYISVQMGFDQENNKLVVSVIDTGIGLTQEQIPRLYEPFTQADSSTTRKYGGTGLGLNISKSLVEFLGGNLAVESTHGLGSKFSFSIDCGVTDKENLVNDLKEIPVTPVNQNYSEAPSLQGNILLAEDNLDNQELISYYIKKTGANLTIAENGLLARNCALETPFDLILMDMQMPEMDGLEATRQLRQSGYDLPIVALTANASSEDVERCNNAGCSGFLSKPVDWEKFFKTLSEHLHAAPVKHVQNHAVSSTLLEKEPELIDLLIKFLTHLPNRLETINYAYRNQDQSVVETLLHELKGLGGNYGYKELTALCARMEFELKKDGLKGLTQSLEELKCLVDKMCAAIPVQASISNEK